MTYLARPHQLCRTCAGSGEAHYPDGSDNLEGYALRMCEACWGSGLEHTVARRAARNADQLMDAAIKAMHGSFGKRKVV